MNRTSIEFADMTHNPIRGCANKCDYCWAEKFHKRYFKGNFKIPEFFNSRLLEKIPALPKKRNYIAEVISPDKPVIFMIDMGDIFSKGVQDIWVKRVFAYCEYNQKANFLFLSKRPENYAKWISAIPKNTFIGTSLDYAHNSKRIEPIRLMGREGYRTFVNIEPLLSRMDQVDFSGIDFVIVGALTGKKYRPDKTWHESINHPVKYYKQNYLNYFPELKNQ